MPALRLDPSPLGQPRNHHLNLDPSHGQGIPVSIRVKTSESRQARLEGAPPPPTHPRLVPSHGIRKPVTTRRPPTSPLAAMPAPAPPPPPSRFPRPRLRRAARQAGRPSAATVNVRTQEAIEVLVFLCSKEWSAHFQAGRPSAAESGAARPGP